MAKVKTYTYGEEFQEKVVALMLQEPTFLERFGLVVHPDYFDSFHCRELVKIITDYYFERQRVPKSTLRVKALIDENFPTDKKMCREMHRLVTAAKKMPVEDRDDVIDLMAEFGRMRNIEAAIAQAADKVRAGEPVDAIWELMDRVRTKSYGGHNDEMDIGALLMDAPSVVAKSGLYNPTKKIATLIPGLDEMLNGGLGRGELGMIVGDTGRGKSTYLVNMGAAAVMQGHPVLHIIVNELKGVDVLMRYSARLTGVTCDDIAAQRNMEEFQRAMADVRTAYDPKIMARKVPSGTTVSMIRSIVSRFSARQSPDRPLGLVLIDDADDLTSRHRMADGYSELGHVYAELKDVGDDFDVAMWVDSQTNRTAGSSDTIKLGHVGNSYKKPQKADVAVTFNQNDDEEEEEMCRLILAKARRAKRRRTREIFCRLDAARMMIMETDPPAEEKKPERRAKRSAPQSREERAERDANRDAREKRAAERHASSNGHLNGSKHNHLNGGSKRHREGMNGSSAHA